MDTSKKGETKRSYNDAVSLVFKPTFVVPGNHDLGDDFYAQAISSYQRQWGADYYSFIHKGSLFLFLNTQLWRNKEESSIHLRKDQDDFLVSVLSKHASTNITSVVVFQHVQVNYD